MNLNVRRVPISSRILYNIDCVVCCDFSSGKHYGVFACDGCAGFFKRSVRRKHNYVCKSRVRGTCRVTKLSRNRCRFCRFNKCLSSGMNRYAVQGERGPRNVKVTPQMPAMPVPNYGQSSGPAFPFLVPPPPMPMPLPIPYNYSNPALQNPSINPFLPYLSLLYAPPTNPPRADSSAEQTCEAAAKILLSNNKWLKDMDHFTTLPDQERLQLVSGSWKDLFVLAVGKFLFPLNVNALLASINYTIDYGGVDKLLRVLSKIAEINLNIEEFEAVRGMILFNQHLLEKVAGSGLVPNTNVKKVINTQRKKYMDVLAVYINTNHPQHPEMRIRTIKKIIRLISGVRSDVIAQLFFRNVLGYNTIEGIIRNMYAAI